jgi:hypothetical protein
VYALEKESALTYKNVFAVGRISLEYRCATGYLTLLSFKDSCFAWHMANQSGESSIGVFLRNLVIIPALDGRIDEKWKVRANGKNAPQP